MPPVEFEAQKAETVPDGEGGGPSDEDLLGYYRDLICELEQLTRKQGFPSVADALQEASRRVDDLKGQADVY